MASGKHTRAAAGPLIAALLAVTSAALGATQSAAAEADFDKLTNEKSAALVTVKFVLQMKGPGGEGEDEREVTGLVVQADGLVLCSNSQLGGGPFVRGSAVPKDIKVLLGDDTQGLDARLMARDSEMDLAWLKIKELGNRKLPFQDLAKSVTPKVGDRLYTIARLGKYFDRATCVRECRVGGMTRKPRMLYVQSQDVARSGMPMFGSTGDLVGVAVSQLPDMEEIGASSPAAFAGYQWVVLPAADVAKATRRALEADTGEDAAEKEAKAETPEEKKE